MSVTVKELIPAKQAENSQTTQYTASNVRAIIDKFTVTNTSASAVTLSVNLVADGGSAGNSNLVTKTRSVNAGETEQFTELVGHVLDAGSFISTIASAATSLTIRCSGREVA